MQRRLHHRQPIHFEHVQQRSLAGIVETKKQHFGILVHESKGLEDVEKPVVSASRPIRLPVEQKHGSTLTMLRTSAVGGPGSLLTRACSLPAAPVRVFRLLLSRGLYFSLATRYSPLPVFSPLPPSLLPPSALPQELDTKPGQLEVNIIR